MGPVLGGEVRKRRPAPGIMHVGKARSGSSVSMPWVAAVGVRGWVWRDEDVRIEKQRTSKHQIDASLSPQKRNPYISCPLSPFPSSQDLEQKLPAFGVRRRRCRCRCPPLRITKPPYLHT